MSEYPETPDAWITHHPMEDEPQGGYCPKCERIAEDCECDTETDYQQDQLAEEREETRKENWQNTL